MSSYEIYCFYMIDTKKRSDVKGIYKYGFTNNLSHEMFKLSRKYDDIELVYWTLIPENSLNEIRYKILICSRPYVYENDYIDNNGDIICLDDEELKRIIDTYEFVTEDYNRNVNEIKHQYNLKIKDMCHKIELNEIVIAHHAEMIELKDSHIAAQSSQIEFLQQLVLKHMSINDVAS